MSHICEALGYPFDERHIARDILDFRADAFALSFTSSHFRYAGPLVAVIKRLLPNAMVVSGGPHAMAAPESIMDIPGMDAVCTGEADGILSEFFARVDRGGAWEKTRGFWVRRHGRVFQNPPASLPDISKQAPLNFAAADYRDLVRRKSGFAEILLGRGCRFKCAFCQNHIYMKLHENSNAKTYVRVRPVQTLIDEMKSFRNAAGGELKGFIFGDDSIDYGKVWLGEFLPAYRHEIGMPFVACLTASQVNRSLAGALYEAGCNVIRIGIETGGEQARKNLLGKPVSDRTLFRACRTLHDAGINIQGFGMCALPEETPDDIMSLLSLAVALGLDVFRLSTYYPLPKTRLYRYCKENNLFQTAPDGYHDFSTESVLKWPEETLLFHDKIRSAFPLLMNALIPGECAEVYGKLADRIKRGSHAAWEKLKQEIPDLSRRLHEKSAAAGLKHYFSPVSDRPDYAFLFLPQRRRKMINIDDKAPADMQAVPRRIKI